ncbi:MAG: hypothetical protein KDB07_08410 [Planctomycetes bacterium]|nr:hypothetical protein [Planctomycetota bacterium]
MNPFAVMLAMLLGLPVVAVVLFAGAYWLFPIYGGGLFVVLTVSIVAATSNGQEILQEIDFRIIRVRATRRAESGGLSEPIIVEGGLSVARGEGGLSYPQAEQ